MYAIVTSLLLFVTFLTRFVTSVTISYMIKCDECGKDLDRKVFCSNKCRVANHRKSKISNITSKVLDKGLPEAILGGKPFEVHKIEPLPPAPEPTLPEKPYLVGFCENHFEKQNYHLIRVSLEDTTGEVLWTRKICPKCARELESHVKKNGGKINYE